MTYGSLIETLRERSKTIGATAPNPAQSSNPCRGKAFGKPSSSPTARLAAECFALGLPGTRARIAGWIIPVGGFRVGLGEAFGCAICLDLARFRAKCFAPTGRMMGGAVLIF
jgi:hypothetical protein